MNLDADEKGLLDAMDQKLSEISPVSEAEKDRLRKIASNTLKKDKRVNIRLNEHDLEAIQRKAIQEGLPYQTLIASLIHKYTTGQLVEKQN